MDAILQFIVGTVVNLNAALRQSLYTVFVENYLDYEEDQTAHNLNVASTALHDHYQFLIQEGHLAIDDQNVPTLQTIMGQIRTCALTENDTDILDTALAAHDLADLVSDGETEDYREEIIRELHSEMNGLLCCRDHLLSMFTYLKVFHCLLDNQDNWDDELVDYAYEYVYVNLCYVRESMIAHEEEILSIY